jgi:mannose-1-phosphate guanylyltransferase
MSLSAMVFAAGFGSRMGALSDWVAKPAIPFYGRPLIAHTLGWLARAGVTRVVINLHHQPESVRAAVAKWCPSSIECIFSEESEILGTGGGLKLAEPLFEGHDTILAVNGDIFTQINLTVPLRVHRLKKPLATLVLNDSAEHQALFGVGIDVDRHITDFWGEPQNEAALRHCAFTGIHVIDPRLFEHLPADGYACIKEAGYLPALANRRYLAGVVTGGHWFDLGTPERYIQAHLQMLNEAEQLSGHPQRNAHVFSAEPLPAGLKVTPPVVVGRNLKFEDGAQIGPSAFIGDNVTLAAAAAVERSVVWDDATVTGAVKHAIVAPNDVIVSAD